MKTFYEFLNEKLKLVKQTDNISCGPASLKMIADFFKISTSLEELKIVMGTDHETGTTDLKMIKGLNYLSLDWTEFKVGNSEESYILLKNALKNNNFILFRTLTKGIKHWICCDYIENDKYHILDPWLDEYFLTKKQLNSVWTPRNYDGFMINGIKKIQIENIKIEKIEKKDINEIVHLTSLIFSNVMNYKTNVKYIYNTTNFDLSVKLTNNDEIIGCYLLNDIKLKKLKNKQGINGVALAIKPMYRGYKLGEKLKDWLEKYAKEKGYDFIFGEHLKGLHNIDQWLKRRELYKETKDSYFTIKYL